LNRREIRQRAGNFGFLTGEQFANRVRQVQRNSFRMVVDAVDDR
jgi:hypothetical protein